MPTNLSDAISDSLTSHAVELERFSVSVAQKVQGQLLTLQETLVNKLTLLDPSHASYTSVERYLAQVTNTINDSYKTISSLHGKELTDLARLESRFANGVLENSIGVSLGQPILVPNVLKKIASNTLIQGAPSAEWWKRQSASMRARFSDEIRQGYLLGESTQDIVRRIRGKHTGRFITRQVGKKMKRFGKFTGGIMDATTREAEALVRTSVGTIANRARLDTFTQNSDVVKGYQAHVTYDNRTSQTCMARAGSAWLQDGSPMPNTPTTESFPGPPPWHWNCRTSLIPVTFSLEEMSTGNKEQKRLARKIDKKAPPRTRQSMNGQVSVDKNQTFDKWLKKQDVTTQKEMLGVGKHKLWKQGKLTLPQMIDQTGRPLSLTQVESSLAKKGDLGVDALRRETSATADIVKFHEVGPAGPSILEPLPVGETANFAFELRNGNTAMGQYLKLKKGNWIAPNRRAPLKEIFFGPGGEVFSASNGVRLSKGLDSIRMPSKFAPDISTLRKASKVKVTAPPLKTIKAKIPKKPVTEIAVSKNATEIEVLLSKIFKLNKNLNGHQKNAIKQALKKMVGSNRLSKSFAKLIARRENRVRIGTLLDENRDCSGIYNFMDTRIELSKQANFIHPMSSTVIHEYGHHLDYLFLKRVNNLTKNAAQKTLANLRQAMFEEFQQARIGAQRIVKTRLNLTEKTYDTLRKAMYPHITKIQAPSVYSLYNSKEWWAESFAHYFESAVTRKRLLRKAPATHKLIEFLLSNDDVAKLLLEA